MFGLLSKVMFWGEFPGGVGGGGEGYSKNVVMWV